ncbi:family 10 glycosylhydrolase [Paenibacillus residui]|uniref:Family 10 glycosylhydrolase n=1 Tax=Paenibacillus residui TaxID=629724 RepID=A0ABW3D8C4_9BACL
MAKWFHQTKSTISLVMVSVLLLSVFVSGANFVAASSASTNDDSVTMATYGLPQTADEESVTKTTYSQLAPSIVRVVEDFGNANVTASFIRATGKLESASRPEPVLYGNHSAKLSYNLIQESGTAAAYVNFLDPGTANYRTLEGKPTKLGLWVYGDGNNKHWLRAEFNTTADVADFTSSSGFNWKGWKYVTVNIPQQLTKPEFTDPIKLRRIYIAQTNDLNKTAGTAYFDRVSVFYGDTGGLYGLDLLGLTPMKTGETQTAQVFETREGYTAPQLVQGPIVFTSSDENVATVDENGTVTAISKGVTTITASYGVFDATYELIVTDDDPFVEHLDLIGAAELQMFEQAQTELFATFRGVSEPVRILTGVTYSSSDEKVATIDENGLIEAHSIGRTTLTASYRNQSDTLELSVGIPIPILQSIKLTGLTAMEIGDSKQAKVIGTYNIEPFEVELKEGVTFTSSNPSVAAIDENGWIQGKSLGISIITAKYGGKNATYTVVVNNPDLQPPKRELRAAWISTVERIDWPKSNDPEQQKQDFIDLLDFHQSLGMNAVVVQVKPTADAFYSSELAPWSHWITGVQGKDPGYDPLAFMIEEAHKRNLEFHAWFNPYRISMNTDMDKLVENHPARQNPDWVMSYGGKLYYDPGVPEAIQYITDSVMEVVKKYDVDGVHFDDYFYPNRFDGEGFPDQATYDKYGKDYPGDINAWRRHNVDTLIYNLSREIKKEKNYVKFGISPFGVWRNKSVDPDGSNTNAGQPSYDNLHADIRKWVIGGWIDYVAPQIYWSFGFAPAAYEILVDWWSELIEEHNANTHLYIGHADYKVGSDANFTDPYEIPNQLIYNLNYEQVKGSIHFTTRDLIGKPDLRNKIAEVYKYPSLVPVMPWLETEAPEAPAIEAFSLLSGIQLNWTDTDDSTAYYVIYRASGDQVPDRNNPAHILTTMRKSDLASYVDRDVTLGKTYTYAVTAVDRLHNESEFSEPRTVTATAAAIVEEAAELSDISAAYGTALESLDLPKTVQVTLNDGTKPSLKVTWDGGTPAYDGHKAGTYVFAGQLELPDGVENPKKIQAEVRVIVKARETETIVKEAAALADIFVDHGTVLADLKLPASVEITFNDDTKAAVAVTWDGGTPAYDGNQAGTYVFSGTLDIPEGVNNPDNIQAIVRVIVKAGPVYAKKAEKLDDISVNYGTAITDLKLPSSVMVTLNDESTTKATVIWDGGTPAYDGHKAGTYVFAGQLKLPDGVGNPDNIQAQVRVIVKAEPIIVKEVSAIADISVQYGTQRSELNLPSSVKVTLSDETTTDAAITWDNGTPAYNGHQAGTYVFVGKLKLPDGVGNPDDIQAAVNVIVRASSGSWSAVHLPPSSTVTLKAGSSGTASLGEEVSIILPEGAFDRDLLLTIRKWNSPLNVSMPEYKLVSPVFEIVKDVEGNFKKPVTLTIAYDPSKVGENQMPSIFYFDEDKREWVEVGGTANDGKVTAEVDHFAKFAVFAVEKTVEEPVIEAPACVDVNFTDINGHWADKHIKDAVQQCLINGYPDHTFQPDKTVSRAEFTLMLARALQLEGNAKPLAFADRNQIGDWAQPAISLAVQAGIINGYEDGSFRPDAQISRVEMAAMIIRALNVELPSDHSTSFADDADIPGWAKGYAAAAVQEGIIRGRDGNQFAPNEHTTRAEAVVMLLRMLDTLN